MRVKACKHDLWRMLGPGMALIIFGALVGNIAATAQDFQGARGRQFEPGNLVVSRSVYDNRPSNVKVGEPLPPNCVAASGACGGMAGYNGLFPYVFNNDNDDASPSAALPSMPLAYDVSKLQADGLPSNMCILAGFPAVANKKLTTITHYPFGFWFANDNTIYVADEGDGYTGGKDLYTHAAAQTLAGLQKWVFDSTTQQWTLAYTMRTGLELGVPYTVPGFPTGTNTATGLPWAPATDGLRNLIGRVDPWGFVTIWAITSTISGNGDTGADSDRLVVVNDVLSNTEPAIAAQEKFHTLRTASFGEVMRGISFTPGTGLDRDGW